MGYELQPKLSSAISNSHIDERFQDYIYFSRALFPNSRELIP